MTIEDLPGSVRRVSGREFLASEGVRAPLRSHVVDLGLSTEPPPPQEFVVQEYIPAGFITLLFAKGGSSKSLLAMFLAFCIVLGKRFFGREVQQGRVLLLDAELDEQTTSRRAWMIAQGLGIEGPPQGLLYHRLSGSLTEPSCNDEVRQMIDEYRPRLLIVDSFTAAIRGKDTNKLDDVAERLRNLDGFGTVLVIDHTSKAVDIGPSVSPIGSVAKSIFVRSSLFIASNGKAALLRHEKSNFGPLAEPVRFALSFSSNMVMLDAPLSADDPRLIGIEGALPAKERLRTAFLTEEYSVGVTAKELAEALEVKRPTISNALTELRRDGVVRNAGKKWFPVNGT